ncbi:MAG: hypothetical protein BroJett011_62820 [Chloroflexota bacterium]|nr:MAG: hypothetical protein BroJett011_62820 [Chloroflexota bacterium]
MNKELKDLTDPLGKVNNLLAGFGLALGAREAFELGRELTNAARAANNARTTLAAAAEGVADYEETMRLAKEQTRGMISETQLAASLATMFGAGLAKNSQEAAQLSSAGSVLTNVFAAAGATQDLYVRLLSSGSVELFNNFGLTLQMVQAKQREIEATTQLTGQEARLAAVKAALIENAQKYQAALTDDAVAAAQFQAAIDDAKAALGQLILPEVTQSLQNIGTVIRGAADSMNELPPAAQGAVDGLISVTNPLSTLNSLIEEYQRLTGTAVESSEALGDSAANAGGAAETEAAALGPVVSSLDAMGFSAVGAAEAHDPLIKKMVEATFRAREAARAYEQSAAASMSASLATTYGGQQDSFTQRRQLAVIQEIGNKRLAYQDDQQRQEEEAARSSERVFKQQTQAMVKATSELGTQISSAVSGAISQNSQDVISKLLGVDTADQNAGEAVRRMAAVAAGGIKDQWAPQLAAQLAGVKDQTAQAFVQAFQQGDDAALKAQAQKLALNPIVELFDANAIANQIEQQLRAQQLQQQLNERVNALLGERGLQAVAGVTQQVGQAVTTTGQAAAQVGADLTGVATSAEGAGNQIGKAFNGALPAVDTLNQRFDLMLGKLSEINKAAGLASGNIAGMNPPAVGAGVPGDAARKMGPPSPL